MSGDVGLAAGSEAGRAGRQGLGSRDTMNPKEGRGEDAEGRGCDWHARVPPDDGVEIMRAGEGVHGTEECKPRRLAIDLREAGAMMSVSAKTVKRLIFCGELKGLKVGAQWRVRVTEIDDYLRRGEQRGEWS